MPKNENDQLFYRSMQLNREWLNEEKRTADLSFSSETDEVQRWFGIEVLDHSARAVDLKRLRSVGAHVFNHDPSRIIGPINSARVDGGRGVANVGYDDTEEGNLALERTKSGSLRGVSFGYRVQELKELAPGEEYQLASRKVKGRSDVPVFIATKWEAIEVTSTCLPADSSVGLGRDLTRSFEGIQVVRSGNSNFNNKDFKKMNEKEVRDCIREEVRLALKGGDSTTNSSSNSDGFSEAERSLINRASGVSPECVSKITEMVIEGRDLAICARELHLFVKTDATDQGGNSGEGTGRRTKTNTSEQRITSFDQVSDDQFFQAFSTNLNPYGI